MPEGTDNRPSVEKIVGGNIHKFRLLRGMSEQQLADSVGGIGAQDILDYEAGNKRASVKQTGKIAEILGIGIAELFRNDTQRDAANDNESHKK